MEIGNEICAKVMGDILARGMSLSKIDLSERVNSEAVCTLDKIKKALSAESVTEKLEKIEQIMSEYGREEG